MHLFVQSVKKYTASKIMLKDESRLYWDEVLSEKAKGLTVHEHLRPKCMSALINIQKCTQVNPSRTRVYVLSFCPVSG